ncbi:hypothetical protein PQX77_015216 [Marasmius sp. AFHP31]|nr:hypothetical protein PQX77_015216 [Marasmius sp. AFHP31]
MGQEEAETETDGGWTTDDESTVRAGGNGGGVSGSTCGDSVGGDSSIDEGERSDAGDVEIENATRTRAYQWVEVWRAGRGASDCVEGDDEREGDSMDLMIRLLGAIWWSMLNERRILREFGGVEGEVLK